MKFVISTSAMRGALATAAKVISPKNTLPILDTVKFSQDGEGRWTFTASDLENHLSMQINIDLQDNPTGMDAFCLPAKALSDMLSAMPEQPLTFDINPNNLEVEVRYQQGRFTFMAIDPIEYPGEVDMQDTALRASMPWSILMDGCTRALPYVADDELRPVMNGIYVDMQPDGLTLAASDGHKLIRRRHPDLPFAERGGFILPHKTVNILKVLPRSEEVKLTVDSRRVRIEGEGYTLSCTQIEGRYPNYNGVIPADNHIHLTADRKLMKDALRRVLSMSNKASSQVVLELLSGGEALKLSAHDYDFSMSGEETMPGTHNATDALRIAFKGTFLNTLLDTAQSEQVTLSFFDPSRACIMTEAEGDDTMLLLLMPMMVND